MNLSLILNSPVFQAERSAVLNGSDSHAYIIDGVQGQGKLSFALAVSCVHFCVSEHKPCFECVGCRKVLEGNHPDVYIIEPDKNMLKVNQVREVISTVYETPYEGKSKIYIFKQFNLANEAAQNALLKTLEEPPKAVTFFLLTENYLSLLPTVISRCKKLRLGNFCEADILRELNSRFPNNEKNVYAAKECYGNIGNAIKLVQDEEYIHLNGTADKILSCVNNNLPVDAAVLIEKEKDSFILLMQILETKLFAAFNRDPSQINLQRLSAVQEALAAKKKNINSGLIVDRLAYTLVKGGIKWQR